MFRCLAAFNVCPLLTRPCAMRSSWYALAWYGCGSAAMIQGTIHCRGRAKAFAPQFFLAFFDFLGPAMAASDPWLHVLFISYYIYTAFAFLVHLCVKVFLMFMVFPYHWAILKAWPQELRPCPSLSRGNF